MAYVSWPDVASRSYVESIIENRVPKIKLVKIPISALSIAAGTSYESPLIDTSFLTNTGTGLVCVEADGDYVKLGSGQDIISVGIKEANGMLLYEKNQIWNDAAGGGTRSSAMLPVMCLLTQSEIATGFKIVITNDEGSGGEPVIINGPIRVKITQAF